MFFIFFLFFFSSGRKIESDENGEFKIVKNLKKSEFTFLWLGDWGGWPAPVYTTPAQIGTCHKISLHVGVYLHQFFYTNF